jgi:hypothetical protein
MPCTTHSLNGQTGLKLAAYGDDQVWRWRFTDEFGRRVAKSWHMSEEQAARYKDAQKIEGTLEIRKPSPSTSDFMRSPPRSTPGNTPNPPGGSSATQLKGLSDEAAVKALAAWCKRQRLEMSFETRRVRHVDVRGSEGKAGAKGVMDPLAPSGSAAPLCGWHVSAGLYNPSALRCQSGQRLFQSLKRLAANLRRQDYLGVRIVTLNRRRNNVHGVL